jgi:hypothetical protein
MLISDFANLPENKSGFWIEKLYSENNQCSFLIYYNGKTCFDDSISKGKKRLIELAKNIKENRHLKVGEHVYDANNKLVGFVWSPLYAYLAE